MNQGVDERVAKDWYDGDWDNGLVWVKVPKPAPEVRIGERSYSIVRVAQSNPYSQEIDVISGSFEKAKISADPEAFKDAIASAVYS